jgi:hypothetical protein
VFWPCIGRCSQMWVFNLSVFKPTPNGDKETSHPTSAYVCGLKIGFTELRDQMVLTRKGSTFHLRKAQIALTWKGFNQIERMNPCSDALAPTRKVAKLIMRSCDLCIIQTLLHRYMSRRKHRLAKQAYMTNTSHCLLYVDHVRSIVQRLDKIYVRVSTSCQFHRHQIYKTAARLLVAILIASLPPSDVKIGVPHEVLEDSINAAYVSATRSSQRSEHQVRWRLPFGLSAQICRFPLRP